MWCFCDGQAPCLLSRNVEVDRWQCTTDTLHVKTNRTCRHSCLCRQWRLSYGIVEGWCTDGGQGLSVCKCHFTSRWCILIKFGVGNRRKKSLVTLYFGQFLCSLKHILCQAQIEHYPIFQKLIIEIRAWFKICIFFFETFFIVIYICMPAFCTYLEFSDVAYVNTDTAWNAVVRKPTSQWARRL
jgi:hypothetical protein